MSENTGRTTRSGNKTKRPGQVVLDADREAAEALGLEQEADKQALLKEAESLQKRLAQIEKSVQKEDVQRRAADTSVHTGQKRKKELADIDSDGQAGEDHIVDLGAESEPDIAPIRGRRKGGGRGKGGTAKAKEAAPVSTTTALLSLIRRLTLSNLQTSKAKPPAVRKKLKKTNDAPDSDTDNGAEAADADVAPSQATKSQAKASTLLHRSLTLN